MWRFYFLHQMDLPAYTDANRLNYAACENVSAQITPDEYDLIRTFTTSNLYSDAQTVRDMSAESGKAEDYIWRVIKRVFRQTAIMRGLWDAERMKLTIPEQGKQNQNECAITEQEKQNQNEHTMPDAGKQNQPERSIPENEKKNVTEQGKQNTHPASVIFHALNDNNLFKPDT